jgi:hypothetical protein
LNTRIIFGEEFTDLERRKYSSQHARGVAHCAGFLTCVCKYMCIIMASLWFFSCTFFFTS